MVQMPAEPVGTLLRRWRERRRLTQLDLSLRAEVSARHLSFVETGRAKPTSSRSRRRDSRSSGPGAEGRTPDALR